MFRSYLRSLANWSPLGRSTRQEYWHFILEQLLIMGGLIVLGLITELISITFGLALLWFFITGWPWIAISSRRFHDAGRSGWLVLILGLTWIIAATAESDGPNQHDRE